MPARALPESCSSLVPLFRNELLAMDDWGCTGHDTPGRGEEWCPDDRVVVTRRGAWELEIGGDARLADPATATCWSRGTHYRVRHPVTGGDHCTVFRLTAAGTSALREASPPTGARKPHPAFAHRTRPLDGRAYLLHRRALERARRAPGTADPLAIEEPALAFLRLMAAGGAAAPHPDRARGASRFVDRARDIIARDFRQPLTLDGLARAAGCSPFHLSRLFRRATGVTLHRAVVRLRLREGLERLLDEPGNMAMIALDTGFASHSHFSDAFRTEYGCSPSGARRMRQVRR